MQVLAHPVRVQILWALGAGEQYVCHLMTSLSRRQSYISQQLAFLRQAGLIVPTRKGQHIGYHLRDENLDELLSKICALIVPDCYACLVIPPPWWLCPCPKCTEIRIQANLPAEPFGSRGVVKRTMAGDCTYSACIRAYRVSTESVAVSLDSNCPDVQRWSAALHLIQVPLHEVSIQSYRQLYDMASDYLCQSNCPVPAFVLQAALLAEQPMNLGNHKVECAMEAA